MRILFQNEPVYGNYEDSGVATSADAHSLVFDEPLTPPPVDGGTGGGAKSKSAPAAGSPLGELEALAKALAQAQGASLVKRAAGEARPKRLRRRTEKAGDKQKSSEPKKQAVEAEQEEEDEEEGDEEDDDDDDDEEEVEEEEEDPEHGEVGEVGDGHSPTLPHLLHHRHHHHLPHQQRASSRMSNTSTSTIKQHYYPEGGWGWIIVLVGVLVHVLTHGLQTAVGVVILAAGRTYRIESIIVTGEVHTCPGRMFSQNAGNKSGMSGVSHFDSCHLERFLIDFIKLNISLVVTDPGRKIWRVGVLGCLQRVGSRGWLVYYCRSKN
uniref:Uncharacterized protein n=1 Tax=Anopheles melas TaxID=34690 RepID=A0A182TIS2_9DIPT